MTSSTSAASTPARDKSSLMTTAPSSCAGVAAKAPLKEPTAVRAALATTMELAEDIFFSRLRAVVFLGIVGTFLALSMIQVKPEIGMAPMLRKQGANGAAR